MLLVPNTAIQIRDIISHTVRDDLRQKVKKKAEDFVNNFDVDSLSIDEGEFVNISFNITTRKGNHLCLRVLRSSDGYEFYLVSVKYKDVDYFAFEDNNF
ncbi:hypothetical protein [Methanothermococcus okinawensis]|uniref:Uncharacterized protein n=1 Tax=Methanothermococcus okinawensis (strain DSM 14208 / JCM 11175 / IH1) TaxID=647113 RepID=F8AKM7_METOI|nr:hypothetical protein [Methanothermococcus okinawensis]AEH06360.1 hypothetical protein Metok_0371 [Methanothermococcus okinawensis IH1]